MSLTATPDALREVSARVATHYHLLPLDLEGETLRVAMAPPVDAALLDEVRVVLGREVTAVPAPREEIEKAIQEHYGIGAATLEGLSGHAAAPAEEAASNGDLENAQDASVVKFVNQIFLEAYRIRATDIHLEPSAEDYRVRYRIDGILYDGKFSENLKRLQSSIISRIKIMADLSIAEKRLPQDGRIKARLEGRDLDMRVSTLPTPFGEGIVIRLLTSRALLDLRHLGFAEGDLKTLEKYLTLPHGILFLTGPTGSGKTTTLYSFLSMINTVDKKIITMEDPVEYQLKGITQVQVNPKIGLTFAAGLRSMLRHDPDVMMVGEVRDLETAEIAIRVALTGHLVFSTLHTNDAAGAVTRLEDIGLEPYLVSSSVLCIIAQRLVRVICPDCRKERPLTPEMAAEFGIPPAEAKGHCLFEGKGCPACNGSGYRGRTVIYEILPVTDELRELVMKRAPAVHLRDKAIEQGMKPLRRCGWEKVLAGITTPEEVLRVTLREGI
jgi:type II secretory ATPase GspE/PulE/Tfp pilus assembly ATPase PilB-like protein